MKQNIHHFIHKKFKNIQYKVLPACHKNIILL